MKKKGLLITLISTVIVVAVVGGMSIGKLFNKDNNPNANPGTEVSDKLKNEGNNKGSREDPFYIYDTESFTTLLKKYGADKKQYREVVKDPVMIEIQKPDGTVEKVQKEENGELVFENRKDEDGYDVYKDVEGIYESYHFELTKDIDFAGVDFEILFNKNNAFTGVINGAGYTVKNITINVTKENFKNNITITDKPYVHLGIFGDLKGATIKNINFDGINIDVENDIFDYLQSSEFYDEFKTSLYEFSIGSIAACATQNTVIEANVNANINADAYSVTMENENKGRNCVGGIVGYAMDSKISNYSTDTLKGSSKVTIIADSRSKSYYLGGVSGYMFNSEYSNLDVSATITASAKVFNPNVANKLYIGGVTGYMLGSTIKDSIVNLTVKQLADEERMPGTGVLSIDNGLYNMVGGVASIIRANNVEGEDGLEPQISKITNVRVNSDVDMDCLFGGLVFEVKSTFLEEEYNAALESGDTYEIEKIMEEYIFVELIDNLVTSKVKTLMAYGIASKLLYTEISFTEDAQYLTATNAVGEDKRYNVLLSGKVVLASNDNMKTTGIISTNAAAYFVHFTPKDIFAMASLEIFNEFSQRDTLLVTGKQLGNFSYVN